MVRHWRPRSFARTPEDFWVEEQLCFEPADAGPHWLLRVEKRAANTRWVALEIARLAQVQAHDVGYAGLKDRRAVTVQWFSVPALGTSADFWREVATLEFTVLEVRGNSRKLKRGALTLQRVGAFDIHPSGPLWGTGELPTQGAVRERERRTRSSGRKCAELRRAAGRRRRRCLRRWGGRRRRP